MTAPLPFARLPRLRGALTALSALALLSGCGGAYGRRVPDELVTKLPYEARIELLEAENDLGVAVDKRDEADNDVLRTRDHLRRAKARLSAAEDEVDDARDATSREVAKLAVQEAEARVHYLRAQQDVNVETADIEGLALRCALARFELSKLQAAHKAKVAGSEKYEPKDFEAQAKACEQDVASRRKALEKEEGARAVKAKAEWDKQKTALAKKTFDARASPYVE